MSNLSTLLLAVPLLLLLASASVPTATIRGRLRLPNPGEHLNRTKVTLNDDLATYTQDDGSFVFHRVPPGVHILDVQSRTYHFSQVKVQLLEGAMGSPKCIEYYYPGAAKQAVPHPLDMVAHAEYQYYEPRQGFSVMGIFKNPMLLMMLFSVGLMYYMPSMMENLDPEQKEQMQRQMAMQQSLQQDPTKALASMFSGGGDSDGAAFAAAAGAAGAAAAPAAASPDKRSRRRGKRE